MLHLLYNVFLLIRPLVKVPFPARAFRESVDQCKGELLDQCVALLGKMLPAQSFDLRLINVAVANFTAGNQPSASLDSFLRMRSPTKAASNHQQEQKEEHHRRHHHRNDHHHHQQQQDESAWKDLDATGMHLLCIEIAPSKYSHFNE